MKDHVQQLNEQLARKINEEALRNPASPYAGKFVGIANGRVVVAADDLDEMARQLRVAEPDAGKTFCIEVGIDYDQPEVIWKVGEIWKSG
jgi:hypothetical protein